MVCVCRGVKHERMGLEGACMCLCVGCECDLCKGAMKICVVCKSMVEMGVLERVWLMCVWCL